jgi:hypothetical protein
VTGTHLAIPITRVLCGGRPFLVHVAAHLAPDGLAVVVDTDNLTAAVRAHQRQHQN